MIKSRLSIRTFPNRAWASKTHSLWVSKTQRKFQLGNVLPTNERFKQCPHGRETGTGKYEASHIASRQSQATYCFGDSSENRGPRLGNSVTSSMLPRPSNLRLPFVSLHSKLFGWEKFRNGADVSQVLWFFSLPKMNSNDGTYLYE